MIIQGDKQLAAKQADTGELEVKVSRNFTQTKTVVERNIYNTFFGKDIQVNSNCKGIYLETRVYALTGTDPFLRIQVSPHTLTGPIYQPVITSANLNAPGLLSTIVLQNGATKGDFSSVGTHDFKLGGLFIPGDASKIYIYYNVAGTFGSGEGIDFISKVITWGDDNSVIS
jgi:hypothetical protein